MTSNLVKLSLQIVAIGLLSGISNVDAVAKTIKIPLIRGTTRTSGQFGQPVVSYYTPVELGTPPKQFMLQPDLGLGDPWLPHYTWNPFKVNLHYGSGFQCKLSSSCRREERETTLNYQECKLTGKVYEDEMSFRSALVVSTNSTANATISPSLSSSSNATQAQLGRFSLRQKFFAMSDASDARFKDLPVDGFLGLPPQPQSSSAISSLLVGLQQARLIDNLQFSFWFNPILDSNQGAELTLGGVDQSRYQGQLYWHHLSSAGSNEWSVNLQFVGIANEPVSCLNQQCQVAFSSALNEIYGPPADVYSIYRKLNANKLGMLHYVDCQRLNQLPSLSFSIDGIPYALLPTNYIRQTADGRCYVAILANPDAANRRWLLGTNFLGAYYSTFDVTYKQVGFASMR